MDAESADSEAIADPSLQIGKQRRPKMRLLLAMKKTERLKSHSSWKSDLQLGSYTDALKLELVTTKPLHEVQSISHSLFGFDAELGRNPVETLIIGKVCSQRSGCLCSRRECRIAGGIGSGSI